MREPLQPAVDVTRKPGRRGAIVRIVRLAVIVEVAWVVVANALLYSGLVEALINRRPEQFSLRWENARTWYPARVQASGLVFELHTWTIDVEVRASRAAASLRFLPLLTLRGVLDAVHVHDVAVEIVREVPEGPAPVPGAEPGLRMALLDVEIHGVERFSFNDIVVAGGVPTVRGNAAIQIRGPLSLSDVALDWRGAQITVGDVKVARALSMDFRGDLRPFRPQREKGREALGKLSGAIDINGNSRDLRPLHLLLPGVEWIERLDGAGDVAVHLLLDQGRLLPGTDIEIVAEGLELWFLGFAAGGSGHVNVDVTESDGVRHGRMEIVFDRFGVSRQGQPEPLASGAGFNFQASARDLGFTEGVEGLDIVLDIPGSEIPDVARLAASLPPGLGIEVSGGSAKLSGHLESHGVEKEATGIVRIDGTDLEGRFRDMGFGMDLAFVTRISGRDLDAFDIQLAGTEMRLLNGAFEGEEDVEDGWWMTIAIPEGLTNLARPARVDAQLELSMRDSRAIIATFAEVNRWIDYFDRFLTVRDVEGDASLSIHGDRFSLRDLSLTGDRLEVMGELALERERHEGIFWAQLGVFSMGVERIGHDNDFKLVRSRRWYEEQHQAHWENR